MERGKVRIGVNLSGLPFGTYKPGTQTPVGFAVDLAQDIGHKLGVETEVVPVVAANRAVFLQQGKVDLLIANMTVTPERAEQLDYVPTPYEQLGGALVAPRHSGITRWEDLKDKTVCISQRRFAVSPRFCWPCVATAVTRLSSTVQSCMNC
ncbi:transporter substrate-binding domain-containing protein [Pseudomonas sp. NPDC088444]|uniref:transporter substrate-binding domain-containing protein n=1 Tax=Pseudomonas sp. NPDC088444 TaxID=3364456 RepID=UPI00384BD7CB